MRVIIFKYRKDFKMTNTDQLSPVMTSLRTLLPSNAVFGRMTTQKVSMFIFLIPFSMISTRMTSGKTGC